MKKMIFIVLLVSVAFLLVSCNSRRILYKDGVYEGIGQGHHGPIKVQVTTDKYQIKEINIIEEQEIPVIRDIVYEKIPERVIKANSTDVDVVAGATLTSKGLIEAVSHAIDEAKIK